MKLKLGFLLISGMVSIAAPAYAQTCTSFPYNPGNGFSNGNEADAGLLWTDFACAAPLGSPNFLGGVGIGPVSNQFTMLTLQGPNTSAAGPDVSYFVSTDTSYPVFEQLNFTHNNVSLDFDAYYSGGAWKSSSSTANFQIYDLSGGLQFNYASGVSPGGNVSWTTGLFLGTTGEVGIGTTSPARTVDVSSSASDTLVGNDAIRLLSSGSSGYGPQLVLNAGSITGARSWGVASTGTLDSGGAGLFVIADNSAGGAARLAINASGDVGIGTTSPAYLLQVGSSSVSGAVAEWQNTSGICTLTPITGLSCSSDARLKKDIVDAGPALPALADMRIRDFTIRATGERMTGVIAQEMLKTHPDMVHKGSDGFYKVDEPNPWKLVKAIQELKADNDHLAFEVRRQQAEIVKERIERTSAERDDAYLRTQLVELTERLAAVEAALRGRNASNLRRLPQPVYMKGQD